MTLADLIKRQEGVRLRVYDDATGKPIGPGSRVVGHPTIGYGRACDVRGITIEEAEYLLSHDLETATKDAAVVVGEAFQGLSKTRQAALTSMAFQMGRQGLAGFPRMLAAVRAGDWRTAKREAMDSAWAKQTPARAKEVAEMLLTGLWPKEPAG